MKGLIMRVVLAAVVLGLLVVAALPLLNLDGSLSLVGSDVKKTKEPEKKGLTPIDDLEPGTPIDDLEPGGESPGPEGEKVKKVVVDEKGEVIDDQEPGPLPTPKGFVICPPGVPYPRDYPPDPPPTGCWDIDDPTKTPLDPAEW